MRILLIGGIVLCLDHASKLLALRLLGNGSAEWLGGLVRLCCTRNSGISFGLFAGNRIVGIVLPLLVVAAGFLFLRSYRPAPFAQTAAGLVFGGFLGNYLERLCSGGVTDLLFFSFLPWFVCNIADICVCGGAVLLGVSLLFRQGDWEKLRTKKGD